MSAKGHWSRLCGWGEEWTVADVTQSRNRVWILLRLLAASEIAGKSGERVTIGRAIERGQV